MTGKLTGKKLLALVLSLAMIVGMVPMMRSQQQVTITAHRPGTGTERNPHRHNLFAKIMMILRL